jgi:hypothetical protein
LNPKEGCLLNRDFLSPPVPAGETLVVEQSVLPPKVNVERKANILEQGSIMELW